MNENAWLPADRVEGLLHMLCEELWEVEDEVRLLACQSADGEPGVVIPLQYLLCTLDAPAGREALRQALPAWRAALDDLGALLDHADDVWAEDRRGWAPFVALHKAPFPVRRPSGPDLRDWDVLLVLERDARFGGSWQGLLEWLHQQGSRANQRDIQRVLQLDGFERAFQVDLRSVLSGEETRSETCLSSDI
ncbi:MAG: hypothetical protein KDI03_13630 [Anaerolineae bacterium]|nr:hypothetical protein [Anaerolineae bacterium]MCB0256327.1 hypothetical protein [Anaerolineae bacterium]